MKGLSPEPLARTQLSIGATVPCDRLYAIENGPCGFDPTAPAYFPKQRFLMLMKNERLAALRTAFDEASHTLVIVHDGREAARGDLRTPRDAPRSNASSHSSAPTNCAGRRKSCMRRATASRMWRARSYRSSTLPRSPRWRMPSGRRSIRCACAATSTWLAGRPGASSICSARRSRSGLRRGCKIVKRIVRCAATEVDPDTGIRDLAIPSTLMRTFGHADCGVYGEVIADGTVAVGDAVVGSCIDHRPSGSAGTPPARRTGSRTTTAH